MAEEQKSLHGLTTEQSLVWLKFLAQQTATFSDKMQKAVKRYAATDSLPAVEIKILRGVSTSADGLSRRRKKTGYNLFFTETMRKLKQDDPNGEGHFKIAAGRWKQLSEAEQTSWKDRAEAEGAPTSAGATGASEDSDEDEDEDEPIVEEPEDDSEASDEEPESPPAKPVHKGKAKAEPEPKGKGKGKRKNEETPVPKSRRAKH